MAEIVERQIYFLIINFNCWQRKTVKVSFWGQVQSGDVRSCKYTQFYLPPGMQLFHIIYRMPTKSKRVQFHKDVKRRRIRKSLSQRIKRLNKKESHFRTCDDEAVPPVVAQNQAMVKVEPKDKVLMKKGRFNFVQNVNARIKDKIDFLLFGMIYIDEEALKSNKRDRSLLRSMFNFYSINSVRITDAFLILKVQLNFNNTYPAGYIIERLKAEGKKEFYHLACMLEAIYNRFANLPMGAKSPSLYDHQIQRQLQKSEGKPCMLMIAPSTIAISKQLIQLTGYSMEYMATSCLLNRSFLFDLFLAENHIEEINTYMSTFDLGGKFKRGELSLAELKQASTYESLTSIIDKANNRVQVKTKRCNLGIGIACWSVEKVVACEKLMEDSLFSQNRERVQFQESRRQRQLKEINNLLQQTPIKSTINSQKLGNACGYRPIDGVKLEHD